MLTATQTKERRREKHQNHRDVIIKAAGGIVREVLLGSNETPNSEPELEPTTEVIC